VLVTFVVEPRRAHLSGAIAVVGDFNGWDPTADVFSPGADGRWRATAVLPAGHRHCFRYLAENGDWFDEPDADDWRPDAQGRVNCVLDLTRICFADEGFGGLALTAAP
jgi:hypothetical protein